MSMTDHYVQKLKEASMLAVSYGFDEMETQQFLDEWCNKHTRVNVRVTTNSDNSGTKWNLHTSSDYVEAEDSWTFSHRAELMAVLGLLRTFGKAAFIAAAGILAIGAALFVLKDVTGP